MPDQIKYTNKLDGARVLIIGGSAGIGYGVAEACVEHNMTVTISSSNPSRVSGAVASLQKAYPSKKDHVSGHACDIGDEKTLESNIKELFEKVGQVDHIVFTAGDSLSRVQLQEADIDGIKQTGMVRFFAPIMMAKHAVRYLSPGPKSSITLTTGTLSEKPREGWGTMGYFGAGLHAVNRGLALDLKPIRVNLISPGAVDTPLWDSLSAEQKADLMKMIGSALPTGRVAQPSDVAEAYIYCMKDINITGSMISTNGGALLV